MLVVVTGVSGSGKTTIGTLLAETFGCGFLDADALHPETNVDPWLTAIHARLLDAFHHGESLVVACSALKDSDRRVLSHGISLTWVYLKGEADTLEVPADAIVAGIAGSPDAIVQEIVVRLRARPDIRILEDLNVLSVRAAETAVGIINEAVRRNGRCSLVLSGGSTPIPLHRLLATTYRDRIRWSHVEVFWGDERYVPHDDVRSNYRMARETLLDHVPCPAANVHPMPTHFPDPDDAARDYQTTLERYWSGREPQLDLVLLGIGPDGHTASLFPGSVALQETKRLVVAATGPAELPRRLTLTYPALARSAHAHFLVSGSDKAAPLSHVFSGADHTLYPAAGVRPSHGWVVWWLDRDAASALTVE